MKTFGMHRSGQRGWSPPRIEITDAEIKDDLLYPATAPRGQRPLRRHLLRRRPR